MTLLLTLLKNTTGAEERLLGYLGWGWGCGWGEGWGSRTRRTVKTSDPFYGAALRLSLRSLSRPDKEAIVSWLQLL